MAQQQKASTQQQEATVIDGRDLILGRMGSTVAKRLLLGEHIKIVNCREVVILGRKQFVIERYRNKLKNRVIKKGPYYSRSPSKMVKRALRNMLPYKADRGEAAFKRLLCYDSVPSTLASVEKSTIEDAKLDQDSVFYYTTMGEVCDSLGNKH